MIFLPWQVPMLHLVYNHRPSALLPMSVTASFTISCHSVSQTPNRAQALLILILWLCSIVPKPPPLCSTSLQKHHQSPIAGLLGAGFNIRPLSPSLFPFPPPWVPHQTVPILQSNHAIFLGVVLAYKQKNSIWFWGDTIQPITGAIPPVWLTPFST
jgi:hypothetical protein